MNPAVDGTIEKSGKYLDWQQYKAENCGKAATFEHYWRIVLSVKRNIRCQNYGCHSQLHTCPKICGWIPIVSRYILTYFRWASFFFYQNCRKPAPKNGTRGKRWHVRTFILVCANFVCITPLFLSRCRDCSPNTLRNSKIVFNQVKSVWEKKVGVLLAKG